MANNAVAKNPRSWEALTPALSEWILDAVTAMGFVRMTPVQASTIPLFMGHKDVVVEAVTGSGKTISFLIPVVEKLLRLDSQVKKHHVGAIIVSPTRELAEQIYNVLLSLLAFHAPSAAMLESSGAGDSAEAPSSGISYSSKTRRIVPQLLLGGTSATPAQDLSRFLKRSPNVLVSTPGRLLELLSSPHVHCPQSSFEMLVLDEADRLLDLGFKDDLQKILGRLPKQRRTGLFSASVSEAVDQIVRVGLRNPVKIAVKVRGASGVDDKRTPASLQMTYLLTPPSHKFLAVKQLLSSVEPTPQKSILYFSTCAAVDYWSLIIPTLLPESFATIPLHGKHPPNVRQKNFTRFSNSVSPSVLLTTDVAARGLDIPSVDLVVQIDPPADPKVYIHRCGRAGRAGRRGLSVLLLTPGREEDYIPFLQVRKTPITKFESHPISVSDADATEAIDTIREIILSDRAIHDKAQRAFVSWVRSYSKHQASSIFRIQDLNWEDLGNAWGLLRLPKMPELREFTGDKFLGLKGVVDWDNYTYTNKQKEKIRKETLEEQKQQRANGDKNNEASSSSMSRKRPASEQSTAWSKTLEKKDDKEKRRERKLAKRENTRVEMMTDDQKGELAKTRRMVEEIRKANKSQLASSSKVSDTIATASATSGAAAAAYAADDAEEFEGFD